MVERISSNSYVYYSQGFNARDTAIQILFSLGCFMVCLVFLFGFQFSKKNKEFPIHFISLIMIKQDVEQTFQSPKQS